MGTIEGVSGTEAMLAAAVMGLFGALMLVIKMVLSRYETLLAAREQERVTVLDTNTRAVIAMQQAMTSMAELLRSHHTEVKDSLKDIEVEMRGRAR